MSKKPAEGLLAFTAGRDMRSTPACDERLIPYDLWASTAHVLMLWKQNILSKKDVSIIVKGLETIGAAYREGRFTLDPGKEDIHSLVESCLVERYGMESAGRIHVGRSRNDQVVVDMRLYLRGELLEYAERLLDLIDSLAGVAGKHRYTAMPGYTHYQPAMITSWGHILVSYAQSLERDFRRMAHWYALFNCNPLGGVAGYGTRFPLSRRLTAQLLGFDGVHESSLDPSHNRWEPETELCYAISIMMNHLSGLAQTLIVLSTAEFGIVRLDDAYCTGSSIMPQKRNPDCLEVIKGKGAYAQGMLVALLSMGQSLFTGYNRDSQWSKYPVMDLVEECKPVPVIMKDIITSLSFNKDAARRACGRSFIAATDVVEWLVQEHALPFREAKVLVEKAVLFAEEGGSASITVEALKRASGEMKITLRIDEKAVDSCQAAEKILEGRKVQGGPSPRELQEVLKRFQRTVKRHRAWLEKKKEQIECARNELRKMVNSLS